MESNYLKKTTTGRSNVLDKLSEIKYLSYIIKEIQDKISLLGESISKGRLTIINLKKDIWNSINEVDSIEIIQKKQEAEQAIIFLEKEAVRLNVLDKLILNPYFAKTKYSYEGEEHFNYIGLSALINKDLELLICDWRSPVASLFYDCELGKVSYETPKGFREVTLMAKRQFKITDSKMIYMVDTSMQVSDDILIEELSKNTSDKMKNIVNTIQKEQNLIIRNENDNILIIQGVAGSGKTSIALHRISFLLYRNRNSLKSNDVIIISPSKVFSDYISKVLPELGEENIIEMNFNDFIKSELLEMDVDLNSDNLETSFTSDHVFSGEANMLRDFVKYKEKNIFEAKDFVVDEYCIDSEFISDLYFRKFKYMGFLSRIEYIYDILVYKNEGDLNVKLSQKDKANIMSFVKSMYTTTSVVDIYILYKKWIDENSDGYSKSFNSEDIYELIFLKSLINKTNNFIHVKHLIIDEMQDYSSIHYEIIKELFNCPMTILGDVFQNISNTHGIRSLDDFDGIFDNDFKIIQLKTSYRSTLEIMELAKHVLNNEIDIIKRHGDKPIIRVLKSSEDMYESIYTDIQAGLNKENSNCAILCKTSKQADEIYNYLKDKIEIFKTTQNSSKFINGITVTTIACAKGLEFDSVFIPFVDSTNYNTELDRNFLYVACTRALHKLYIYSHSGSISGFLTNKELN